ncbi:MAG: MDR family oxidoreductase [Pseudomonadota bacterium]
MLDKFSALVLDEVDGKAHATLKTLSVADLPDEDVHVQVTHSTLNYKDGMVVAGNIGNLVRNFPHVPGIDLAGSVIASRDDRYKPGDKVVLTGWRVGESYWGGYAAQAKVRGDWLVPLPKDLSCMHAMAVGTAGLTAMLCIMALENHGCNPDKGTVLVTGGAGGVGSVAITLLHQLGYKVATSTGRPALHDYLRSLGADEIIAREDLSEPTKRPLEKELWVGAVDTVGGTTLGRLLGQLQYGGSVAACGLAGGAALQGTVLPFLLRGANILGIDSVMQPFQNRVTAWERLATLLPKEKLDSMTSTCTLDEVPGKAKDILKGEIQGRLVINLEK